MKKAFIVVGVVSVLLLSLLVGLALAQEGGTPVGESFSGQIAAPDFVPGLEWVNVPAPLSLADVAGKVVVLDFWTYGCINCIHMIPTLERLEEKYPNELVVIGVHSAKFANEGDTQNIRQIVQRYDLHHPVINDKDFITWRQYGVNAWPTFVIIDPEGKVLARQGGEIPFEAFDRVIGGMIAQFDGEGKINREPLTVSLEGAGEPSKPLAFPGKVRVDESGQRLFIADSNHHRIVVADLNTYKVLDVIGSGQRGFDDGDYAGATFNKPQGMALVDNILYVADTNNHAIRAIDLDSKMVTTIAGTGTMGTSRLPTGTTITDPRVLDLRSPWDVEVGDNDTLFIAMAGTHQIWSLNLATNILTVSVVGSGAEALLNATLETSELAQPSGLFYVDGLLYFADSESSSIRVADFPQNAVRTIAGPPENTLFDFGDVDGAFGQARLQHALGVTGAPDGLIYIADTYNSKIKVYDPATTTTRTFLGLGGDGGFQDGDLATAQFDEPGGIDYANGKLYVADTNNNAIRVIDIAAQTVSTVTFPNPELLQIADAVTIIGGNETLNTTVELPEQNLSSGTGEVVLKLSVPEGYKINDLIASTIGLSALGGTIQIADESITTEINEPEVHIPITLESGSDTLFADLTIYFCREGEESLCFIDSVVIQAPVNVAPATGVNNAIVIERTLVPPVVPESSF